MDYSMALDIAIKRCEGNIFEWNHFYNIYPFTTENINGYIKLFDLKEKSLLTVGSSCDQVLNGILMGTKDITILDKNPFTKYYYYLKIAAILELNINEYLLFLRYKDYPKVFKDNKDVFKNEIFKKIVLTLRLLDYDSYLFWDDLFQMYSPILVREKLFSNDENRNVNDYNPYLKNSESYNMLRDMVKKTSINFIYGNIEEINLNKTYDNIWFSNILTNGWTFLKIKKLCSNYFENLNENGMMLVSYLYDTTIDTKYLDNWSDIYDLDKIFNLLDNYNPELKTFVGVKGILFNDYKYKRDSVLVCRKKK